MDLLFFDFVARRRTQKLLDKDNLKQRSRETEDEDLEEEDDEDEEAGGGFEDDYRDNPRGGRSGAYAVSFKNGVSLPIPGGERFGGVRRKSSRFRMTRRAIIQLWSRQIRQARLILRRIVKCQVFYWLVITLVFLNTACVASGPSGCL